MGDRLAVLNAGVLQQLDTPQAIYDRPANLFVARFIGSPAMNVLPARVESADDGAVVAVAGGSGRRRSAPARAAAVRELAEPDVLLGVRPEHLTLAGSAGADGSTVGDQPGADGSAVGRQPGGDGATLAGRVDLVERLGSELFVYVETAVGSVTARVPADAPVAVDQTVRLAVAGPIHLFDPRTDRALRAPA